MNFKDSMRFLIDCFILLTLIIYLLPFSSYSKQSYRIMMLTVCGKFLIVLYERVGFPKFNQTYLISLLQASGFYI